MRVLILSVTAGFGHHATAKAIGDMLESKGAEVHTRDVYAYISNLIKTTIDKGYLFSSKHMQTLYRLVYQLAENNGASYFNSAPSIINIINALGASKFAKVIANHVPDVIICTHVFAAQMVDELKKRKKLADIETIGIVTDYTLHPYWEDVPRVQYIVTASELLTYRCVQRGIPEDRIFKFGKADNFWEHGSGPCGPCSEIYYDRGPAYGCGKPGCTVGCDCDRYIEVWNIVFSQFDNDGEGHYTELKQKNIDTGMGLERLACVCQGVDSLFDVREPQQGRVPPGHHRPHPLRHLHDL